MSIDVIVTINAPCSVVWSTWMDIATWPEWTPSMTSVVPLDTAPLHVGSRARIRQPRLPSTVWTVTDLVVESSFEWEAHMPGVTIVAKHHVVAHAEGGCEVTLSLEHRGRLGRILAFTDRRFAARNIALEARGLKQRAESSTSSR